MLKIALEGMEFFAFHGYYEEERKAGNLFVVDLEVDMLERDDNLDEIEDTVNYENLYDLCKSEMKQTKKLLETVAQTIAKKVKQKHASVQSVSVTIRKKTVQLGGPLASAKIIYKH